MAHAFGIVSLVIMNMSPAHKSHVLALYRNILRQGARFPSKKRLAILSDIRLEFREKAHLTDPKDVRVAVHIAEQGLETMLKYTTLDKDASDWSVTLEQDPLNIGFSQAMKDFERKK